MARIMSPEGLHDPTSYGYSHVAVTEDFVFIAGQYASDENGEVVSSDFAEQAARSFENLGVALGAAGLDFSDAVKIGTYVVDPDFEKLGTVAGLVNEHWGEKPPTQTLIGVAALALPGMLFEVDAIAAR